MIIIEDYNTDTLKKYLYQIHKEFTFEINIQNIQEYSKKLVKLAKIYYLKDDKVYTGMAAIYINDTVNKVAYISLISILKQNHKSGNGQQLLNHIIQIAIIAQMRAIKLEVQKMNQPAIQFYKKNKFTIQSETETSYFMILHLKD